MTWTTSQRTTETTTAVVRCRATLLPNWTNTCTCECVFKMLVLCEKIKNRTRLGWTVGVIRTCVCCCCSLPYSEFFGGVSGLTVEQFRKINGFPNAFWGWGGEDDDLWNRLVCFGGMGRVYTFSFRLFSWSNQVLFHTFDAKNNN